jgi:hypothetical protein
MLRQRSLTRLATTLGKERWNISIAGKNITDALIEKYGILEP